MKTCKMKRVIRMTVVFTLCLSLMMLVPCTGVGAANGAGKIYTDLREKMKQADDDDLISVSVWITDIDHSKERGLTEAYLKEELESGEVSSLTLDVVFGTGHNPNTTAKEMRTVISAKRKAVLQLLAENNKNICDKLMEEYPDLELIAISDMIPCLNFYLTKDQINALAEKDYVDELLFLDMGLKFSDADAADSDSPRFTIYEKDGNIIYRDSLPFTTENSSYTDPEFLYMTTGENSDGSKFDILDNFKGYGTAGDAYSNTVIGGFAYRTNVALSDAVLIYKDDVLYSLTEAYDKGIIEDTALFRAVNDYLEKDVKPALAKFTKPLCKTLIVGDINSDGRVDITDATLVQMYIANRSLVKIDPPLIANVNGDKRININDVTLIQKKAARIIDSFGMSRYVCGDL